MENRRSIQVSFWMVENASNVAINSTYRSILMTKWHHQVDAARLNVRITLLQLFENWFPLFSV